MNRDDVAVCAADCRLMAFQSVEDSTRFWIKVTTVYIVAYYMIIIINYYARFRKLSKQMMFKTDMLQHILNLFCADSTLIGPEVFD